MTTATTESYITEERASLIAGAVHEMFFQLCTTGVFKEENAKLKGKTDAQVKKIRAGSVPLAVQGLMNQVRSVQGQLPAQEQKEAMAELITLTVNTLKAEPVVFQTIVQEYKTVSEKSFVELF